MNPTEQKTHTRRMDALETKFRHFQAALEATTEEALSQMDLSLREFVREQVGEERTHRLQLANEQRTYVDHADKMNHLLSTGTRQEWEAFTGLRFWGRLKWLITGRRPL